MKAADVNGDNFINTIDIVAIQRFFLGAPTGIANVGKYYFMPTTRTYSGIETNQTEQNYDGVVFGDVVAPFSTGAVNASPIAAEYETEIVPTVAVVALPNIAVDSSINEFNAEVVTSTIDPRSNLIGFQGDLTFDSTALAFDSPPVEAAGLTSHNWNVSGNVLPGVGPIRTLRVSAFSLDFVPLAGAGTLFELRITRLNKAGQITQLLWAPPPDHFIFIDADLNTERPVYTAPGSVSPDRSSGQR